METRHEVLSLFLMVLMLLWTLLPSLHSSLHLLTLPSVLSFLPPLSSSPGFLHVLVFFWTSKWGIYHMHAHPCVCASMHLSGRRGRGRAYSSRLPSEHEATCRAWPQDLWDHWDTWWLSGWASLLGSGRDAGIWDPVLHQVPCGEPASPSAYVSASLSLCLSWINK